MTSLVSQSSAPVQELSSEQPVVSVQSALEDALTVLPGKTRSSRSPNDRRREEIEAELRRRLYLSCINQVALQAVLYGERRVFGFGAPLDVDDQLTLIANYEPRLLIPEDSVLSINQLHTELLEQIFFYAVDGCVLVMEMRHTLESVCRRWRMVALGCPEIWKDVNPPRRESWVQQDLDRSSISGHPNLIIYLQLYTMPPDMSFVRAIELRKADWRSIYLRYSDPRYIPSLFENSQRPVIFTSCRRLHLNMVEDSLPRRRRGVPLQPPSTQISKSVEDLLLSVPLLEDLTLEDVQVYAEMLVPSLVRLNLLRVKIELPVIRLLPKLASLRYLSVAAEMFIRKDDFAKRLLAPNSFHLLSLDTLVIDGPRLFRIIGILRAFVCPRLRCLSVPYRSSPDERDGACADLRDIILEKAWDIRYLDVGYSSDATTDERDSTWKEPLGVMTNLRCFAAQAGLVLGVAHDSFPACPHLEEVIFYDPESYQLGRIINWTTRIRQAVRTIIKSGAPLRRIRLLQSSRERRSDIHAFNMHYKTQKNLVILGNLVDVYTSWNDSPFLGSVRDDSPLWPTFDPKTANGNPNRSRWKAFHGTSETSDVDELLSSNPIPGQRS